MRTLAFRRHQESKRKAWVKRTLKHNWAGSLTPTRIGVLAHSPALCSCYGCGNPRKYSGEGKISEIRLLESMKLEINNWIVG